MNNAAAYFVLGVLCFASPVGNADPYHVARFTIDSGGGEAAGNGFTLTGTLGQPDAGHDMQGGSFSMTGGFWTGRAFVVQSDGMPELLIRKENAFVVLWWASEDEAIKLQFVESLQSQVWMDVQQVPKRENGASEISLLPQIDKMYFRLRK